MAEIIRVFREEVPAMRFIGKRYEGFGPMWGEWFASGWFDQLEAVMGGVESILRIWPDGGGYVGLERHADSQPFEYWIGMFTPADTAVPEGFSFVDFPALALGTCWLRGPEAEVHDTSTCRPALEAQGMQIWQDERGGEWSFENCLCPRYTTPDENGAVILDYCHYVI